MHIYILYPKRNSHTSVAEQTTYMLPCSHCTLTVSCDINKAKQRILLYILRLGICDYFAQSCYYTGYLIQDTKEIFRSCQTCSIDKQKQHVYAIQICGSISLNNTYLEAAQRLLLLHRIEHYRRGIVQFPLGYPFCTDLNRFDAILKMERKLCTLPCAFDNQHRHWDG